MDADDAPGNDTTCHVTCHVSLSRSGHWLAPYVRIITISVHLLLATALTNIHARREGGESLPGSRDVWGAQPSLKNTENGVPGGSFLT